MRPGRPARPLSRPVLLTTVALGGMLAPLNSTMVAVALPELRADFAVGPGTLGWLISSYLIAMAVAQPLGGRIGDQLGRARVLRWGLGAFFGFSLAAAVAPSLLVLVLMRTGQALVGAAIIPNGLAMLRESLPSDRLGRSLGLIGAAMSLAAAAGPLIGAALLTAGSWRLLFLVNVPFVLVAVICMKWLGYQDRRGRARVALDVPGALALGGILVAVTLVLGSLGGAGDWIAPLVGGVSLLVLVPLFIRGQQASPVPVVEWQLFRRRSFAGATAYVLFSNLVMYTALVAVPFFVEEVMGGGSAASGPLLAAMSAAFAVASPVGGRLSDRSGRRGPALAGGLVVIIAAAGLLAVVTRETSPTLLAGALALLGLGLGLGSGPAIAAATEAAPREEAGAAAGVNSMMRYVGGIAGVGLLSTVFDASGGTPPGVALFGAVFAVLFVVALLAAASTLFIGGRLLPLPTLGGHR
jgi:EmrB/QacA subfamily drug resistance transporter